MKKRRIPKLPDKKPTTRYPAGDPESGFKYFFQNHPFPTIVFSLNSLEILEFNEDARTLFNFPAMSIAPIYIRDIFSEEVIGNLLNTDRKKQPLLTTIIKGTGDKFFAEIYSYRIDWQGEMAQVLMVQKVWDENFQTPEAKNFTLPWRLLIENSPDIILTVNSQGIITYINKTENIFPGASVVGSPVFNFIHPSYKELLKESLHRVFDLGKISRTELLTLVKPREYRWFSVRIAPLKIGTHIPLVTLSLTDISEQKEIESYLGLFRNLIDHSNEAFFVVELHSEKILDINERVSMDLGFLKEEIQGEPFLKIFPDTEKERVRTLLNSILTQESITFEAQLEHKNHTTFPVEMSLKHIVLENVDYLLVSARDVAHRKSVENKLKDLQANILAILESTDDAIWSIDSDFRLLHGNSKFFEGIQEYYGIVPEIGKPIYEFLPLEEMPEFTNSWLNWYGRALNGERFTIENSYEIKGELRYFLISFHPINKDGKITGATVFLKDITERKKTEKYIRASEEKWRSLVQNSPDFIYIVDRKGRVKFINH